MLNSRCEGCPNEPKCRSATVSMRRWPSVLPPSNRCSLICSTTPRQDRISGVARFRCLRGCSCVEAAMPTRSFSTRAILGSHLPTDTDTTRPRSTRLHRYRQHCRLSSARRQCSAPRWWDKKKKKRPSFFARHARHSSFWLSRPLRVNSDPARGLKPTSAREFSSQKPTNFFSPCARSTANPSIRFALICT